MIQMLLRMSLTGGVMILVIALARSLLQYRVHRGVFLLLWGIAVLRLLLPGFAPTRLMGTSEILLPAAPVSVAQSAVPPASLVDAMPSERSSDPSAVLMVLWGAGAVTCAAIFLGGHLMARRRYRFSLPAPVGAAVPEGLRVRRLEGLESPLTYGIFRPVVLLPSDFPWEDGEQLRHVLLHEQGHIRRWDTLRKLVLLCAVCIHWFNPLVWLMLFLASRDMEIRCDALVVRTLGRGHRAAYARTLVTAQCSKLSGILQTGFAVNATQRRLEAMKKAKPRWLATLAAAMVLCLVLTASFLTSQVVYAMAEQPLMEFLPPVPTEPRPSPVIHGEATHLPEDPEVYVTEPTEPVYWPEVSDSYYTNTEEAMSEVSDSYSSNTGNSTSEEFDTQAWLQQQIAEYDEKQSAAREIHRSGASSYSVNSPVGYWFEAPGVNTYTGSNGNTTTVISLEPSFGYGSKPSSPPGPQRCIP